MFDELAMVDHFVLAAELGIILEEGIQAMRAMGEDFADVVFGERGDIGGGEFLEQEFVAEAAGGFAGAFFFAAQNGEVDVCALQQFHHGPSHPLRASIK